MYKKREGRKKPASQEGREIGGKQASKQTAKEASKQRGRLGSKQPRKQASKQASNQPQNHEPQKPKTMNILNVFDASELGKTG